MIKKISCVGLIAFTALSSEAFLNRDPLWNDFPFMTGPSYASVDVHQTKTHITLRFMLPGFKKKDVEVSLSDSNFLAVKAHHKRKEVQDEKDSFESMRSERNYHQSFRLPWDVDANSIEASLEDGVLTVTMKKRSEETRDSRKIKIRG